MKSQSPVPNKVRKVEVQLAFPEAMRALIGGSKIRRVEWGDKEEYGFLNDNFLMLRRGGALHTWIVSEGDLMAIDWVIL